MTNEDSNMAAQSICFAADQVKMSWQEAAWEYQRPSVVFKPELFKDGDAWCALFGADLQVGIAGFGPTPSAAMYAFDTAWRKENGSCIIEATEPTP